MTDCGAVQCGAVQCGAVRVCDRGGAANAFAPLNVTNRKKYVLLQATECVTTLPHGITRNHSESHGIAQNHASQVVAYTHCVCFTVYAKRSSAPKYKCAVLCSSELVARLLGCVRRYLFARRADHSASKYSTVDLMRINFKVNTAMRTRKAQDALVAGRSRSIAIVTRCSRCTCCVLASIFGARNGCHFAQLQEGTLLYICVIIAYIHCLLCSRPLMTHRRTTCDSGSAKKCAKSRRLQTRTQMSILKSQVGKLKCQVAKKLKLANSNVNFEN